MESFYCEYCCLKVNNISTMQTHLAGKKHQRQKAILEQRKNESMRSVYIKNLPFVDNIKQLLDDYFVKFGPVENVILIKCSAIIVFSDVSSANEVLASRHWIHGKRLIVQRKRLEHPQLRKNMEEFQQAVTLDENKKKYLLERISSCKSVEQQMIILQTELCLTKESMNVRGEIQNVLYSVLTPYFPNSELHLFGSSANGFGFEGCDVDLHLKLPQSWSNLEDEKLIEEVPAINEVEAGNIKIELLSNSAKLKLIRKIVKRHISNAKQMLFIPSLRCPLLRFKYKHYRDELICDLTIGKCISVRNTKLLLIYRQLDSRVLLLVTTLRWWAKCQQLINSDCKLTSYAFIFMVIYFLQNINPPLVPTVEELAQLAETEYVIDNWNCSFCENLNKIPKSANKQSAEELLRNFFQFYAKFDFKTVISPRFGHGISHSVISSDPVSKEFKIGPVCIQDPFILNRNIAGNFNPKYLPEFVAKFSFCAQLLSKTDQHTQGNVYGVATLMREIPVEDDENDPLSFFVISKSSMFKNDASFANSSSEQQIMTDWLKTVCSVVEDIFKKSLCAECEIIVDRLKESELQLTRKRSHSFSYDNGQQQKHFMGSLALEDRTAANHPTVSSSATSNVFGNPEQPVVPFVKSGNTETVNYTNSLNENCPTESNECYVDVHSDNSEVESKISTLQQPGNPNADKLPNEVLLHMRCKVHDNIWHQRKKMSKKYKLDRQNILDVEREISQEILKQHGNNKHFLFDCQVQKDLVGGIVRAKCELKPLSKSSFEKLKQFIVPFVSKLVNKCLTNSG